jgi:uncharacterized protein (TIGR00730 family)
VEELAGRIASWSEARRLRGFPAYVVGTGGGPGLMAAANKGALEAGGRSAGFGISLPYEKTLNCYVEERLAFNFHYFATRKITTAYRMMGLVIAPGGFGTCDELFEILTLKQAGKIKHDVPAVLVCSWFCRKAINWEAFVEHGVASRRDVDSLVVADTAHEAFEALVAGIVRVEENVRVPPEGGEPEVATQEATDAANGGGSLTRLASVMRPL